MPRTSSSLLGDVRELIRQELALARTEIREELSTMKMAALSFAGAALPALLGVILFCLAAAGALAYALGWPAFSGCGLAALVLLAGAGMLSWYGSKQFASLRALPETRATIKGHLTWIQNRSASK
jgi:hypothetical protein